MKTYILGIDISTSIVGFAVMTMDYELVAYDKLKFKKNLTLEEKAKYFKNKIEHFDSYYCVSEVFVEQPAMMFGRGRTTANTMAKSGIHGPETKCLEPFKIQSSPSRRAFDFMPITSEPASGSDKANNSLFSPRTAGRRYCSR